MLLASTFTFGDALLAVLEFALLFLWIWIAVGVIFDVFRSSDLSNWGKALWLLLILFMPLIGVLVYLIVRGHTMHEHAAHRSGTRGRVPEVGTDRRLERAGGRPEQARRPEGEGRPLGRRVPAREGEGPRGLRARACRSTR